MAINPILYSYLPITPYYFSLIQTTIHCPKWIIMLELRKSFGEDYIMGHLIKICLASLVCVLFSMTALPSAQAASQSTIQIKAEIISSNFWDYTFIKDSSPSKPSSVKVQWSSGNMGSNPKELLIIPAGKTLGQVDIVAEKGELINLNVCVVNSKNEILGKWGMQITNKGQNESVSISLPENTEAVLTRTTI